PVVHQHRARATLTLLTGVLGARQPEPLPQDVEQALTQPGADHVVFGVVDREVVVLRRRHPGNILVTARRAMTATQWRRYSAVARWSSMGRAAAATMPPNSTASAG